MLFLLLAVMALEASGADGSSAISMREIDAGEILAKVQKGQPVEYDHVVVRGNLDLSWERLHRNITSPIRINDSIFKGLVSFNSSTFEMPAILSGSNFARDVYFQGTTFSSYAIFDGATFGYADFDGSTFSALAYFPGATFNGVAFFKGASFKDDADFEEATFSGEAQFEKTIFSGKTQFGEATFNGDAYFWWATLSGVAYFGEATFKGEATFSRASFSGDAYFWYAIFSRRADFWDASFSGDFTYFSGVNFGDYAQFEGANFSGSADFVGATFDGISRFMGTAFGDDATFGGATFSDNSTFAKAEFNGNIEFSHIGFENETSFYQILFKRPAYFENSSINSLNLTKAEYSRLHLRWDDIDSLHFDEAAYLALIKNYNSLGWYGDANDCYYDYRNAVRENWMSPSLGFAARLSNFLDRLIDFGEWLLYGYGVKPSIPIAWSAAIILAFGLFFWHKKCLRKIIVEERIEDSSEGPDEVQIKTTARKAEINALDPILFSLFTFTSGFTSFLHPTIEYKLERCVRWAIFERLLGPFFMALVITTISKTYLIR